jgi:polygalacturonase
MAAQTRYGESEISPPFATIGANNFGPDNTKMKTQLISPTTLSVLMLCLGGITSAAESPAGYFNVRDFGAAGDGKTLDSPAIDKAIDAAAAAGGGTVFVPAGIYLSGSIHLKSNLHLIIGVGATILGAPQSMGVYDETESYTLGGYQDGGHCYFHNSLIWGENLTNVSISGDGTINGGGLVRDDKILDAMVGFDHFNPPVTTNAPPVRLGNKAIALKLCKNVLLRDFTIAHGGHFAVLVTGCDNMTVDNVTMDTDRDGIDIDCCRNTMVSNCRINAPNDDALCPKSDYALGEVRPTENLTIVNCQVSGFAEGTLLDGTMQPSRVHNGRIKFGTESSGGFRNCTVANCTFRYCHGLALEEVDGGIMDNITINNLSMMDVPGYGIYITTGERNRTPGVTTNSRARNILISNVVGDGIGKTCGIQIMGLPGHPVEGVRLENIRFTCVGGGNKADAERVPKELGAGYPEPGKLGTLPAYGIYARHVHDLGLANITLDFQGEELRPAIFCTDVNGLDIDNFKAKLTDGVPASKFENVSGATVRNSPVLQ